MASEPYNMFAIGQRVWMRADEVTGEVLARWWGKDDEGHRRAWYRVACDVPMQDGTIDHRETVVKTGQLRAADFCCDGCGRWLPTSSMDAFNEDVILCYLCTRVEADRDIRKLRQEIEESMYDVEYERAQASEQWERMHGGGL